MWVRERVYCITCICVRACVRACVWTCILFLCVIYVFPIRLLIRSNAYGVNK